MPRERLASGPGLVAAAFGLDTGWTGVDLCDPASPLRLEAARRRRATARGDRHAPDRHRLRRPAVGRPAVALRRARSPVGLGPGRPALTGPTAMDQRSIEPARVPGDPRAPGGRDLVRTRRGGWPRRSSRRTIRSSSPASLDETDQARALLEERPGRRHRRPPTTSARPIERAARGGRLEPAQFLEIATTLDATARLATLLADERRPLLRELGRELHALPALRSTLARSFDPVGELLDTASPRLGGLRAAVRVAYDRLRRRLDALVGSELGSAAPGADHHAAQRPLRRAGQVGGPVAGSRASSTTRRAAARPCSSSRSSRSSWATPGARRRSPRPRRSRASSTSCRRSWRPTPTPCARRSRRSPSSTSGRPRRRSPPRCDASRAETDRADRGDPAVGPPSRA